MFFFRTEIVLLPWCTGRRLSRSWRSLTPAGSSRQLFTQRCSSPRSPHSSVSKVLSLSLSLSHTHSYSLSLSLSLCSSFCYTCSSVAARKEAEPMAMATLQEDEPDEPGKCKFMAWRSSYLVWNIKYMEDDKLNTYLCPLGSGVLFAWLCILNAVRINCILLGGIAIMCFLDDRGAHCRGEGDHQTHAAAH